MKELLKNIVYTGVGAAFLTKDKIEELKSELIDKGKMTQDEGKQFVDELIGKSEKAKDEFELWLNRKVEDRIKCLDLVTIDELNDLKRQVEELQLVLNKPETDSE